MNTYIKSFLSLQLDSYYLIHIIIKVYTDIIMHFRTSGIRNKDKAFSIYNMHEYNKSQPLQYIFSDNSSTSIKTHFIQDEFTVTIWNCDEALVFNPYEPCESWSKKEGKPITRDNERSYYTIKAWKSIRLQIR